MPDKLAHQSVRGIDNFTAEELELLQQKDEAALHRANARLEQRVRARTAELAQTNAALLAEIQAHKQVEHEQTQLLVREQVLRRRLEAQLRASLQEKEVLLKEVHHRVKNNLQVVASLLDMQADTVEDRSIRTLFEDSQQRIQSIALIHESLYQSGDVVAQVNAADYLPRLSQQLFKVYRSPSDRLTLRVHAEPVWLAVPTAVPCGLLVTELVTNSFKHAFPDGLVGEIHMTLRQDPAGACVLIVGDTGVGLPKGLDVRATESLGWQLVGLLTEQLRGTIELEGHGGTTVTITFPL
ncbi:MAG: sensor histidine kinase [Candidatus Entotheonellia bacterium]